MAAPDPDPLTPRYLGPCFEEFRERPGDRWPYLCVLPEGHEGPHGWGGGVNEPKSGFVITRRASQFMWKRLRETTLAYREAVAALAREEADDDR